MKNLRNPQILASQYIEDQMIKIRETVKDGRVLLALSGGVDCSVCAALLSKAIGKRLTCVFVDHGCMRKNEAREVKNAFADWDLNLIIVNAEERFLSKLKGVTDPETKRKLIGAEFIRVFEEESAKLGETEFLAQGTIYTDVIESGDKNNVAVKSHHNVGGLPDSMNFRGIIEPVRELYKDEVREISGLLGLPDYITKRQPFPGPGLAIRVIGEVTKKRLDILRNADYIYREEITTAGLNNDINQYFAVLTDMRSVGVKDGKRVYDYILALRAIKSADLVTADFAKIPYEVLEKVSGRITSEVDGISRVVYDITKKPPGTIEWE